ncbi:MAG: DNA polymerase III subunit delta [Bacilli bacterium]|nr:DNA polymerase III subunit delta [Bacilli bacterium]
MNIYLISGTSYKQIEEAQNKILESNSKNITIINYNDSSIEDILSEASYFSLFDDEKTLIVKNSNFFSTAKLTDKEDKMFNDYLANPNPATTIIFETYEKLDSRKKIVKTMKDKFKVIELPLLKNNEVILKINNYMKENKFSIDSKASEYIAASNNYNYDLIINELDKIMLYYDKPCKIEYSDAYKLTSSVLNDNNFKYVDAMINKNLQLAIKYFNELIKMKTDPIALINLLAREYRLTYMVGFLNKSTNEFNISRSLGLQNWQVSKYIKQAYNYSLDDLLIKLNRLGNLDYKIKSGKVDKFIGLRLFMLENS